MANLTRVLRWSASVCAVLSLGAWSAGCSNVRTISQPGAANKVDTTPAPGGPLPDLGETNNKGKTPDGALRLSQPVDGRIFFNKEAVLTGKFLYTANLQHSTVRKSAKSPELQQVVADTMRPCRFRVDGSTLQLVALNDREYSSDSNHPETLISTFKIYSQTETEIITGPAESGATLIRRMGGNTDLKRQWVRSIQLAAPTALLTQETSVEAANGELKEFLEAIMPEDRMVASKTFKKITGEDDLNDRYEFLITYGYFKNGTRENLAFHHDVGDEAPATKTIDWHWSGNIPTEVLPMIKDGVESWNRYFMQMEGIKRPVLRLVGKLPDDVKLGDPRYNVISWDNFLDAGSAWASCTAERSTGKVSGCLIYLPLMWLQEGRLEFGKETLTEGGIKNRPDSPHALTQEQFAALTFKSIVMHEVGHALGLDHNFKGSLSIDLSKKTSTLPASIMDYNHYGQAVRAFDNVEGPGGPLLEYDRQILSVLYNDSKDIKPDAPVLPKCYDTDPNENGEVDPFCQTFDIGSDPTLALERAFKRIESASMEGEITLSQALKNALTAATDPARLKTDEIKDKEQWVSALRDVESSARKALGNQIEDADESVSTSTSSSLPFLRMFQAGAVAADQEEALRSRAFKNLIKAATITSIPKPVLDVLADYPTALASILEKTPYFSKLSAAEQEAAKAELTKTPESTQESILSRFASLRTDVLGMLEATPESPYFAGKVGERQFDFESAFLELGQQTFSDKSLEHDERQSAANLVLSFKGRPTGDAAVLKMLESMREEYRSATTSTDREWLLELIRKFEAPIKD